LVITRSVSVKYQPVTIAKYMFLVSAVVAAPFGLSDLSSQKVFSIDTTGLALGLLGYSLVFSTFLAFFLMPYALKRLEAGSVSIFMNLQPIVASAAAIAVGQDFLSWEKIAAVILVVAGVYFVTSRQRIQQGVKP
jgi:drug/metabolite transporter (DMT)-like permease